MIPELSLGLRPPEIAQRGYQLIYQITGNNDPFHQAKIEANRAALAIYPCLKKMIANSEYPLLTACKLAIAGNSIDLAPDFTQVNTDNIIEIALASPLGINDYQQFRSSINDSHYILYLGNNASEIVFDSLLIEELHQVKKLNAAYKLLMDYCNNYKYSFREENVVRAYPHDEYLRKYYYGWFEGI